MWLIVDYKGCLKGTGETSGSIPEQLKHVMCFQIHPNEFCPTMIEPSTATPFCKDTVIVQNLLGDPFGEFHHTCVVISDIW